MPKRTDIHSILIIGAGPIVIGQACEFDYSGAQACKALRAEGYRVILVNSNPATIMTDPGLADATYIEPITPEIVEKIIIREKPDAILPTMGGQTALNTAMQLHANGALARHGVELIGAKADVIDRAEDRLKFRDAMSEIGIESPRSAIAHNMAEAREALALVGLPAVIRPSFTLGGTGGGIVHTEAELEAGYASGDSNPFDDASTGFSFNRDFKVGLVLWDEVMLFQSQNGAARLADPNLVGRPPNGVDLLPTEGAVTNALYLKPTVRWRPALLDGKVLVAGGSGGAGPGGRGDRPVAAWLRPDGGPVVPHWGGAVRGRMAEGGHRPGLHAGRAGADSGRTDGGAGRAQRIRGVPAVQGAQHRADGGADFAPLQQREDGGPHPGDGGRHSRGVRHA